ncbi:MAG: hypothetical protein H7Y42_13400 [Chitinophagaceae bacterium]|nr:hypothetical protein [Chitinophagaceae bacterium]
MIWTAVATTAAAVVVYYIRKRRMANSESPTPYKRTKHLTNAFSRAKSVATGEFTL